MRCANTLREAEAVTRGHGRDTDGTRTRLFILVKSRDQFWKSVLTRKIPIQKHFTSAKTARTILEIQFNRKIHDGKQFGLVSGAALWPNTHLP